MVCPTLFSEIDKLIPEYMDMWCDVCNIESPTSFKEGVDKVGEYFIDVAKKHGWEIDVMPHNKAGNAICITMNSSSKERPFCLSGHMDTVHPVGMFGYPAVRVEGDKIYGPGVADRKGGIVVAVLAMHALEKVGFAGRPVRLILQSDEEVNSSLSEKATIDYMCKSSEDAIAFINLEASSTTELCIVRKGIINYKFTINGVEAHSSACAVRGANAIADASHKIIELEKFKDAAGVTCNIGVISGGTVVNTVAGKCEFLANFRFSDTEQVDEIKSFVEELAKISHVKGCSSSFEITSYRPAMVKTEKNVQFYNDLCHIFEENGLEHIEAGSRTGGSDAAYITEYGIPCVDSLGVIGGAIHSINEFAYVSSLGERAKYIAAAIYGM